MFWFRKDKKKWQLKNIRNKTKLLLNLSLLRRWSSVFVPQISEVLFVHSSVDVMDVRNQNAKSSVPGCSVQCILFLSIFILYNLFTIVFFFSFFLFLRFFSFSIQFTGKQTNNTQKQNSSSNIHTSTASIWLTQRNNDRIKQSQFTILNNFGFVWSNVLTIF